MRVYRSFSELAGNTPLAEICNYQRIRGLEAKIFVKLEYFNPAGSIKDRAAKFMIEDAESKGMLKAGGVIIEPTSGNTGIGLAAFAAAKGYRVILTMPETMSVERRKLMKAYGAEVVLTDGAEGMAGAVRRAAELNAQISGSVVLGQFKNTSNAAAHFCTTGPEIWDGTDGEVDVLVAGVGTGGTLSGAGRYLKSKNPAIKVVAVEPSSSPLLSCGKAGAHAIQGIGANFVPELFDFSVCDEILRVEDEEAFYAARELCKTEGYLVGVSSGAALRAATLLAEKEENAGKIIVAVLPDGGERYLSTPLFEG